MSFENIAPTGDSGVTAPTAGNPDNPSPVSTEGNDQLLGILQKRVDDKETFIEQMKIENADMRNQVKDLKGQLEGARTIDELVTHVNQPAEDNTQAAPTTREMTQAVMNEIKRNNNMTSVEKAMKENHGTDYANVVRLKAIEMGISVGQLDEMCYSSPSAAIKLFGGDKPHSIAPTTSDVSAHTIAPSDGSTETDMSFYSKLRRENPREYWKPEVQKKVRQLILKNKTENS